MASPTPNGADAPAVLCDHVAAALPVSERSPFPAIAGELARQIDAALLKLRSISSAEADRPLAPGKWSPKHVIGHLIDSAANNHQRFVRAQEGAALEFPAYAQDHWVASQDYQRRGWDELTSFWHSYNRHLSHVIGRIPEDRRNVLCRIGTAGPVTLGYLVHDYLVHLRHHLAQLRALS